MRGARRDVAGRFRTIDDIRTLLARDGKVEAPAAGAALLVKPAGEDDWQPLHVDGD